MNLDCIEKIEMFEFGMNREKNMIYENSKIEVIKIKKDRARNIIREYSQLYEKLKTKDNEEEFLDELNDNRPFIDLNNVSHMNTIDIVDYIKYYQIFSAFIFILTITNKDLRRIMPYITELKKYGRYSEKMLYGYKPYVVRPILIFDGERFDDFIEADNISGDILYYSDEQIRYIEKFTRKNTINKIIEEYI